MIPSQVNNLFQIQHHALLFGYLARSIIQNFPTNGKPAIKQAVVSYALERGKRMALRTKFFGLESTMENFLLFGEWIAEPNLMDQKIVQKTPVYITQVSKCPWCDYWKKEDLLPYGQLYCEFIDDNLVKGYDSKFGLEIEGVLTKGDNFCEFHWNGVEFDEKKSKKFHEKQKWINGLCKKSWEFHTAHLYWTMVRELTVHLGNQVTESLQQVRQEFSARFSQNHLKIIQSYEQYDFSTIHYCNSKISIIGFGNLLESLFPAMVDVWGANDVQDRFGATTADMNQIEQKRKKFNIPILLEDNLRMLRELEPDIIFFAPPPSIAPSIIENDLQEYYSYLRKTKRKLPTIYAFPPIPKIAFYEKMLGTDVNIVQILPNDIRYINGHPVMGTGHHFSTFSKSWKMQNYEELLHFFGRFGKIFPLESTQILPLLITRVITTAILKLIVLLYKEFKWNYDPAFHQALLSQLYDNFVNSSSYSSENPNLQEILALLINSKERKLEFRELKLHHNLIGFIFSGLYQGIQEYMQENQLEWDQFKPVIDEMIDLNLKQASLETIQSLEQHLSMAATKGGLLETCGLLLSSDLMPFITTMQQETSENRDSSLSAQWVKKITDIIRNICQKVLNHGKKLLDS
jgi:pyrroline-5-carboxylate reductase